MSHNLWRLHEITQTFRQKSRRLSKSLVRQDWSCFIEIITRIYLLIWTCTQILKIQTSTFLWKLSSIIFILFSVHLFAVRKKLNSRPTDYNFECLAKLIIADIIVFCRRRPGEVSRATLDQWSHLDCSDFSGLVEENIFSQSQLNAAMRISVFHVPGKYTTIVPVLVTEKMRGRVES